MKMKLALAAVAIMLGQGAMAQQEPQQQQPQPQQQIPQACPDIASLQAVGLTTAIQDPDMKTAWWGMTSNDMFGTNTSWTFFAGPVYAQDQQGVIDAVNARLSTLAATANGPLTMYNGTFICIYESGQQDDFMAVTITPPFSVDSMATLLRQAKNKRK